MKNMIADSCAQHPMNWAAMAIQEDGQKIHFFGERHQAFLSEFKQKMQEYQSFGKDIKGKEKIQWVRQFLPDYLKMCQHFYQEFINDCSIFELDSPEMKKCAKKYDRRYQRILQRHFAQETKKNKFINYGSLNIARLEEIASELERRPASVSDP